MSMAGEPPRIRRADSLIARPPSRKRSVSHRAIAKRARRIVWAKRLLPAVALAVLAMTILWPEFTRMTRASREAVRHLDSAAAISGELLDAHYRGVDQRGHAYTVTATSGRQVSPEVVDLTAPKADTTLEGGAWVMAQADHGVYLQHKAQLDLFGQVTLYRDDGIFLHTATATIDLKSGFAAGSHVVSAEGPFGTLDATGFALADKGAVIQFTGPARLVLNAKAQ
jgi:lipopolysaccharide export system protein LptC